MSSPQRTSSATDRAPLDPPGQGAGTGSTRGPDGTPGLAPHAPSPAPRPGPSFRPSLATSLPIPLFIGLMVFAHLALAHTDHYDPTWLILVGNFLGVTVVALAVAYIALRNYQASGRLQTLLLGCGVLIFGIGGVLAAVARSLPDGANLNVTIYNTGAAVSGSFHLAAAFFLLAGASPEMGSKHRGRWLLVGYAGSALFMVAVTAASIAEWLPPFFVQGVGPTTLRQEVLGVANLLFLFSFVVFVGSYLRTRESFLYWYACALALTCISLTAFFIQQSVGSPVGWVGRMSQYVGGVYFLLSLASAARTAQTSGTSLNDVLTRSLTGAEERFRALAENSPDAIRRFDRQLSQLYANAAGQRLYGRQAARSESQGTGLRQAVLKVFATGEPVEVEEQLAVADGKRFLDSRCVAERDPAGEVANVLVVTRDITDHKRAEEALQSLKTQLECRVRERTAELDHAMGALDAERRRFRDVLEMLPAYVVLITSDHHVRLANRYFEERFGKAGGRRCYEYLFGRATPCEDCETFEALEKGAPHHWEWRGSDGRDYEVHDFPFTDVDGSRLVLEMGIDVTEKKRAEAAVHKERQRLYDVLETLPAMVSLLTPDHRVAFGNRAFRETFGEPRGRRCHEQCFGRSAPCDFCEAYTVLETGQPHRWELVGPHGDTFLEAHDFPFADNDGSPLILEMNIDITARKRNEAELRDLNETLEQRVTERTTALRELNERLEQADRRKNEFLAVLSHELRNPLAPIASSLYVLDHAAPGAEQVGTARQVIGRQVKHLSNLINDLLDVTRIARNKIQLQKEPLELNEVVRRAVDDHRTLFEHAGLRVELTPAREPVAVSADATRVAQIVGNLLQNSVKFASPGGCTRVSVATDGDDAVVRITDDGAGIEPATLSRLFEPFMQAEQTLERSKGGLGLGLALVKGLAELHGGSVTAHSDGLGKGTELVVRLPRGPGVTPPQTISPAAPVKSRRRILVIEDNVDAADTLGEALRLGGHEVTVAYDGRSGLARARALLPEVVLCDIGLPGMDGFEVARAFRADERLRGAYLVALSGYALPADLERAAAAGFARHLAKPPSIDMLEEVLAEVPATSGGPIAPAT